MKVAIMQDIHLSERTPEMRSDDYGEECLRKFDWCLNTAESEGCAAVLISGDMFDSVNTPKRFLGKVGRVLEDRGIHIVAVPGQHDLRYHTSDTSDTPIGMFAEMGLLNIATMDKPFILKDIKIYGCGWGSEHKLDELPNSEKYRNILLIHKMITKDKPLFNEQEDWISSKSFMQKHPFDLICSGDNHQEFFKYYGDHLLVNGGSMMRIKSDQLDHKPKLHIVDMDTLELQSIKITIKPSHEVFKMDMIEKNLKKKESKDRLASFMESIDIKETKPDFIKTLEIVVNEASPEDSVRDEVNSIMNTVLGDKNGSKNSTKIA